MVDGLNKDVLQQLSDDQKVVAEAVPAPVNDPDPVPVIEPAAEAPPSKPAARAGAAKRESASK